ncbi:uncharacterized protein [Ptychodera flava]|uniref:uncharacterized protein n=1 Tax=Ptychodera flava TaxID=63121 RepID=UPI00396A6F89
MQHGIQEGITAHPMVIEPCIRRFGEFIQKSVESTPFYKPFLRLKNLSNITEDKKLEIQKTGVQLIKDNLQATFKKFVSFLKEDYIPNAKCGISRSSITNGTNYYQAALTFYLTCDVTPKEVHDIGHREVKRLRGEMQKIMKKVDFEGTLQEFYEYLQRDKQFYFDNEEQYLGSFRETLERIRKQLPKYFKNIPRIELQVRGIDAGYKALINAYYVGPSPSGNRPGIVNINCSDPKTRPSYEVMSLTLHEAEPGHHLQCSYSLVQDHLPGFRRLKDERQFCTVPSRFPKNTGYIEGWGMYCEFLGEEMGMYEGDSYSLFGRYCQELVRACRCVTDTGLNFFDWSKERVAEFFHENTTFPDDLIEADIIRYMKSPGQACSYTISLMKFKELRQRAQDKLGEKFDIKEFHDVVLSCGLVPLTVLELIVNRYIEKTLKTSH